jgi:hypothetical protein
LTAIRMAEAKLAVPSGEAPPTKIAGAYLFGATGLLEAQLLNAIGDAATKLPEGLALPAHWPSSAPQSPH